MAEIKVGTKLQSVRNGLIATVTEINDKYKTVIVDLSDGTNHSYSLATLRDKRAWSIIGGEEEVKPAEKKKSVKDKSAAAPISETPKCPRMNSADIDDEVISKFVKKAQKIIIAASHDENGYHITIEIEDKTKSFDDKNLQNIRAALGHIYRGEDQI